MGRELSTAHPRLRVRGISKTFGSHRALDDIVLDVRAGELHGLVGQNGCGKSTLVKVLTGYHAPDPGGEITVDGEPLTLPVSPLAARARGVSVVHQSLGLLDDHSVVENMRLGRFGASRWSRRILWSRERASAAAALDRLGCRVDLDAKAGGLSEQDRATVAIARALQDLPDGGGLIVFDESTRALTRDSLAHFYDLVRTVLALGASALMINHRIEEVIEQADRVTVLRDGRVVEAGLDTSGLTEADLVRAMLGYELRPLPGGRADRAGRDGGVTAHVKAGGGLGDLSISVAAGEVVGVTGVIGSGFEEVPYLLAGARQAHGELRIGGRRIPLGRSRHRELLRAGVALVPERRETEGLALELSVLENLTLPRVGDRRPWWTGHDWQRREALEMIELLGVRPPHPGLPVGSLSGGNQQKVQLAKWLAGKPRLLLVHEPTHAVDVGARQDIAVAIHRAAAEGCAVLVASADPAELALLCDRVLIFDGGVIVDELNGPPGAAEIVESTFGPRRPPVAGG
ncbi:ribose transport system ATP-binding protein [Actinocorallia herbida]|uniref:Ribose transport system ATP-binding protein n=1 Tax=Actinocorallia herbida TaxID=58109 RepID=A0A3N1D0Z7_9ACTN|nr:sugar ABC transporter ATP-binding protein [Actinocorallia herbida]ROO87194.1 ribose transport system ATP-binding protein [Actinocorallia herbida]